MRRTSRAWSVTGAFIAATWMIGTMSPSEAASGSVRIRVAKAGFIVGVGGGSGVLHFHGKNYRFKVEGLSAGTIGIAQADLVGVAHNLHTAADIEGSYSAGSASVAVAGGAKAVQLQNAKGVVLDLKGKQAGFEASLSLSGINIKLE